MFSQADAQRICQMNTDSVAPVPDPRTDLYVPRDLQELETMQRVIRAGVFWTGIRVWRRMVDTVPMADRSKIFRPRAEYNFSSSSSFWTSDRSHMRLKIDELQASTFNWQAISEDNLDYCFSIIITNPISPTPFIVTGCDTSLKFICKQLPFL